MKYGCISKLNPPAVTLPITPIVLTIGVIGKIMFQWSISYRLFRVFFQPLTKDIYLLARRLTCLYPPVSLYTTKIH